MKTKEINLQELGLGYKLICIKDWYCFTKGRVYTVEKITHFPDMMECIVVRNDKHINIGISLGKVMEIFKSCICNIEENEALDIFKAGEYLLCKKSSSCGYSLTQGKYYEIISVFKYKDKYMVNLINDDNRCIGIGLKDACNFFVQAEKPKGCDIKSGANISVEEERGDNVNHPSHYSWLKEKIGIEPIDITRHMGFNLGNAIKYILRAGHKKDASMTNAQKELEDLRKANWYIEDKIRTLKEKMNENNRINS